MQVKACMWGCVGVRLACYGVIWGCVGVMLGCCGGAEGTCWRLRAFYAADDMDSLFYYRLSFC